MSESRTARVSQSTPSMSHKNRLIAFGNQAGFRVEDKCDSVRAIGVRCLLVGGAVGTCSIEKSCDQTSRKPNSRIGDDVHVVKITIDKESDGLVYQADGTPIGSRINTDGKTWSNISVKKGDPDNPEEDKSVYDLIHRYARQIIGAVFAAEDTDAVLPTVPGPFEIPNTFEQRAAVGPMHDRVREQRVAIIGLGGTGAYVLDLIAKIPVREIHILDPDHVEWHNLMRAPGAPVADEIKSLHKECPLPKVDYYHAKYAAFRRDIHPHAVQVDSTAMFDEFLSKHPLDYAFVCVDQKIEGDSSRQDVVYHSLSKGGIPFIDSGVSVTLEDHAVRGAVTISAHDAGSMEWKNVIPDARVEGGVPGYRNVQLPEVNALAATLAVIEWRRRTKQFVNESTTILHKCRLEKPKFFEPPNTQ